jgi:hypothetical protein
MKKRSRKGKGVALVEAALVLPVLIGLIIGGIDASLAVGARNDLNSIAFMTAACWANPTSRTGVCPDVQNYAQQRAQGLTLGNWRNLTAVETPCGANCDQVTLTYPYHAIGPWFPSITLRATAQAFENSGGGGGGGGGS